MPTSCPTCAGSYETTQPGGTYLHACAPVLDKIIVMRAGAKQVLAPAAVQAGDTEVDRTYVERPNKVDQTIRSTTTKGG